MRNFLITLNILALTLLTVIYYLGFAKWDVSIPIYWILPIATAILAGLLASITAWRKYSLNWSISGAGASIAVIISVVVFLNYFSYTMLPEGSIYQDGQATLENKALSNLFSKDTPDNRFIVVKPNTALLDNYDIDLVKDELESSGYSLDGLVDLLFEANTEQESLALNSSLSDGYYIDYNEFSDGYLVEENGISPTSNSKRLWPQIKEFAEVSKPVYDSEAGYGIIYYANIANSLKPLGSAELYLFTYDDEQIEIAEIIPLWVY